MVMEYCPNMDLFTYVAELATIGDESLCHALFLQITNIVNYMHTEKMMSHLDIKLENIVVDQHYFIKLIDFAYCERVNASLTASLGTERYFAPEVARIFY
jgi:serine/threonine protein kinase